MKKSRSGPADDRRPRIAVVDSSRCMGCESCVDACFDNAIAVYGFAEVDPTRCIGCGECVPACPNDALSLGRVLLAYDVTD